MSESSLESLLIIMAIAVLAPVAVDLRPSLRLPIVVVEIGLGILVGPQVLGWAQVTEIVDFLGQLGLAFLFFLAGFEIDFAKIRGRPLALGSAGWVLSLLLALAIGGVLHATGFVISQILVAMCLCTTALGTLMPILRDAGELKTRFGSFVLGAGAVGEFGPIVLVALILTSQSARWLTTLLLVAFVLIAVGAAVLALRFRPTRIVRLLGQTMHASGQLPVRLAILLLIGLVVLAEELSLDILLGAFAAGLVVALASGGEDAKPLRIKLEGIGYGFLVPIFFVVTGMQFDLDALLASPSTILRLPLFLALFLLVRGLPVLLYRRDLAGPDLPPLALYSATALPLVVAITAIGVDTGQMRTENAAALVGAGMISVFVFPLLALALRKRGAPERMVTA